MVDNSSDQACGAAADMKKARISGPFLQADEGTRTLDLLHGKNNLNAARSSETQRFRAFRAPSVGSGRLVSALFWLRNG
jgi:hypothetical protein